MNESPKERPASAFLRMTEIVSIIDIAPDICAIRMRDGNELFVGDGATSTWARFVDMNDIDGSDPDPFLEVTLTCGVRVTRRQP